MFSKTKKTKKREKRRIFLLHCRFVGGLQGVEEGAKGTLTFIPTPISSSPHSSPSFLAFLSPHCASFSKTVFSTGGSYRNYREPGIDTKGSFRDREAS